MIDDKVTGKAVRAQLNTRANRMDDPRLNPVLKVNLSKKYNIDYFSHILHLVSTLYPIFDILCVVVETQHCALSLTEKRNVNNVNN